MNIPNLTEFFLFIGYKILLTILIPIYQLIYDIETYYSWNKLIAGWAVFIAIITISILKLKDYYAASYKFLFIVVGITSILIYEFEAIETTSFLKVIFYWFTLLFAFIIVQKLKVPIQLKFITIKNQQLQYFILFIGLVFSFILSGVYANFRFTISFDQVYTHRLEMRAAQMPVIVNYILFFIGGTILPYCFAYFLSKKSILLAGVALLCGIIVFSINGMKTWLLVYLLIVGVFVSLSINKKYLISFILLAFCAWIILSIFSFVNQQNLNYIALLGRTVYLPSKIGYNYITFFDENTFLFLRESILRFFFDSPYPINSGFYIVDGATADALTTSRANNGLWGDAYANFAHLGLLVYPFLLAFTIYALKNSLRQKNDKLLISLVFILLWSAINNSFFTWLLTGGVLVLLTINIISSPKNNYS